MTSTLAAASTATAGAAPTRYQSVPREFLDPPNAWNPTVGLFLAGYGLAALTIWGWFVGQWSLPVLLALGFVAPVTEAVVNELGVKLDPRGNVAADMVAYKTSAEKVFACGDMRRGQSLVVWAIREGRQTAHSVDKFLMGTTTLPR